MNGGIKFLCALRRNVRRLLNFDQNISHKYITIDQCGKYIRNTHGGIIH